MIENIDSTPSPDEPPPRAFTQGVGTVFQVGGVTLFLLMMGICCLSSLLSKEVANRVDRTEIGWHLPGDLPAVPSYSYARAMTLSVSFGVFLGMAMAGVGLGLQAQRGAAPLFGIVVTGFGTVFWSIQTAFAIRPLGSPILAILALMFVVFFGVMLSLAIGAWREMRHSPPPIGFENLAADYKVPYSHMHQDPPEVRLAHELAQRRERLAVQQKELEALELRMKHKFEKE